MKLMRTLLWAMVLIPVLLSAQPTQEEARRMARSEASRQGVDPNALEARLQARGVNTTALTMSDIPRVQPIVEEEIAKMKAEQSAATNAEANETVETGGEVTQSVNELSDAPEPLVVEKAVVVTEAPTKTIKNIRAHSAKLKINLHPSSAQVGPPSKALLIPAKNPKYSICVSRGIPQFGVNIEISSNDKFCR